MAARCRTMGAREGRAMALPEIYAKVLAPDHMRALEDAITWSVDHALGDLAAIEQADSADEAIDWSDLAFLSGLPARYRHVYTPLFAKQFVVCLVVATHKMADPERIGEGMLSCVAEEFAAHLVIEEAKGLLAADRQERGLDDEGIDFGGAYELMFEDTDFEWLYDPEMDGVERDPTLVSELGVAHLDFEKWFTPFSKRQVHSYVDRNSHG